MFAVFLRILNNAVLSSFVIGAVILMRLILRRSPKWLTAATWGLVAIRLLLPFSLASPTSLIPNAKPLEAIGVFESADESAVPVTEKGDKTALANVSDEIGHDASEKVRRSASEPTVSPGSGLTPAEQRGDDPAHPYSDVTDAAPTADDESEAISDPVKSEPEAVAGEKAFTPSEESAPASEASAPADKAAAPASKENVPASEANIPAFEAAEKAGVAKAAPDADEPGTAVSPSAAHAIGSIVMWIWLGAALALIGFEIGSYLVTRLRLRTATRLEDGVFQSERVPGPFVLGFFRPRIYMPYRISEGAAKYALEHERAHIKRRDNIAKPLAFVLVAVYWFDPLVWLAYVLFCRDIELACDEKVIRAYDEKQRKAYASALLEIGSGRNLLNTVICPLAFGNVSVKERIKKVVNYKKVSAVAVAAAILLGALTAAFFLTDPISADKDGNLKLADTASEEIAEKSGTAAPDADTDKAPADGTEASDESESSAEPILAPGVRLDAGPTFSAETELAETEELSETEAADIKTVESTSENKKEEAVSQIPFRYSVLDVESGTYKPLKSTVGAELDSAIKSLDKSKEYYVYAVTFKIKPGVIGFYDSVPKVDYAGLFPSLNVVNEEYRKAQTNDVYQNWPLQKMSWFVMDEEDYIPSYVDKKNSSGEWVRKYGSFNFDLVFAAPDTEKCEFEPYVVFDTDTEVFNYFKPNSAVEHYYSGTILPEGFDVNNASTLVRFQNCYYYDKNNIPSPFLANEEMSAILKEIGSYGYVEEVFIQIDPIVYLEASESEPKKVTFADGHSGDANKDGVTDVEDMKAVIAVFKTERVWPVDRGARGEVLDPYAADCNGDGRITADDYYMIGHALSYTDNEIREIAKTVASVEIICGSGDVNADGVVDLEDLGMIISACKTYNIKPGGIWRVYFDREQTCGISDPYVADVNGDGLINSNDIAEIAKDLGYSEDLLAQIYESIDPEWPEPGTYFLAPGRSGNVNRDGIVNVDDMRAIALWIKFDIEKDNTGNIIPVKYEIDKTAADTDNDGRISSRDCIVLGITLGYTYNECIGIIDEVFAKYESGALDDIFEGGANNMLIGDANADGIVDVEDMKAIVLSIKDERRTVEDGPKGDLRDPYAADVNEDGKINAKDYVRIGKYLGYTLDEISEISNAWIES